VADDANHYQVTHSQRAGDLHTLDGEDEEVVMEEVTLRLKDQYAMPLVCCACAAPAGAGGLGVSAGTSRRSVSISFPLCARCAHANSTIERRRRIGCWGALGLSVFLCVGAIGIEMAFGVDSDTAGISLDNHVIGGLLLLLAVLTLAAGLVIQWLTPTIGLAPEVRQAYKQVSKAARIKSYRPGYIGRGYITFALRNDQFAALFREINAEAVVEITPGELISRVLLIVLAVAFSVVASYLLYSGIVFKKLVLYGTVIEEPILIAFGLVMLAPPLAALLRLVVATLARVLFRKR
jgi:hypothetical protein